MTLHLTLPNFGADRKAYETLKNCVNELADLKTAIPQCRDVTTLDTKTKRFFELKRIQPSQLIYYKEIKDVNNLLAKNISSVKLALLTQYSTIYKSTSIFQSFFGRIASIVSQEPTPYERLLQETNLPND